jgi:hypothetical protein
MSTRVPSPGLDRGYLALYARRVGGSVAAAVSCCRDTILLKKHCFGVGKEERNSVLPGHTGRKTGSYHCLVYGVLFAAQELYMAFDMGQDIGGDFVLGQQT